MPDLLVLKERIVETVEFAGVVVILVGGVAATPAGFIEWRRRAFSDAYRAYRRNLGRALYLFMADKGKQASACYDACAGAWPPLITKGKPQAGDPAVKHDLIGTIERKDGARQVTYGGWPLYYFVNARSGRKGFGAEWYRDSRPWTHLRQRLRTRIVRRCASESGSGTR